jgi:hypothetical protein
VPPPPVAAVHGMSPARARVKGTLAGKMALAAWRKRRIPSVAVRSARLARADARAGGPPPEDPRRDFRAVFVVPVGPGERAGLEDTIASIRAFEGEDAKIVVADDGTPDSRRALVRRDHPDVSVVRAAWPTGGPPRQSHFLTGVYAWALARYRFDVLVKIDADALVTGPGLTERAAQAFAADPALGMLGTTGRRADGEAEDYSYDAWVLAHETRRSAAVRRLERAARAGGFTGQKVHGGVYLLGREALRAAWHGGWLAWRPPWWSLLNEDTVVSMTVLAAGHRLGSWGAPGEPTVSGQGYLPIEKEAVMRDGKLAVHSVRRGPRGETEPELRAYFRGLREAA